MRRWLPALPALLALPIAGVFACSAIVGVEDVKLRKAEADDDAGFEDDPPIDDTPTDKDAGGTNPVQENLLEVALGTLHTCARKPTGAVSCWGDDSKGQTGTGGTAADGGIVGAPQSVAISDATKIAAGNNHTCAVHTNGTVSCWGDNLDGQLGNGQTNARSSTPVDVTGLSDATSVAAGSNFTCALRKRGGVSCWGDGLSGQLGNGAKTARPTPTPVSGLNDAVAISAGEAHACAVTSTGTVVCWGNGFNGQLGNGTSGESSTPVTVPALDDVIAVTAATRTTCALKRAGSVFCWGANELGQLGSGAANATPNPSPVIVTGLDATAIFAGADHACAVRKTGNVACWGAGYQGQLGDGQTRASASTPQPSPVEVSGLTTAIGIGTGGNHSCAPNKSGAIFCWGENGRRQLGDGTATGQFSPVSVVGFP